MQAKDCRKTSFFPVTFFCPFPVTFSLSPGVHSVNDNIKYFFVAIDVFSRFAVVIAMKNKLANTIIKAMKESFDVMVGKPKIINCDNGSEFINGNFKKFAKDNDIDISYVQVGDHKK